MAKKIDFSDDVDGKGEELEVAAVAKEDPKADPVIDLDAIDDDDEDTVSEERGGRAKGRNSRYWMNREQREAYEADIRRRDEELTLLRQQQAMYLQQQQAMLARQSAPVEQRDPVDDEIQTLTQRGKLIRDQHDLKRRSGQLTLEEHRQLEEELNKVELSIVEKVTEKKLRQHMPQQGNPQQAALKTHIDMTYPDVVANPSAIRWAAGYETQQLAMGRQPPLEEIMESTRKQFRMGRYNQTAPRVPPAYMRDRLSGAPRGGSAGTGEAPRQFVMTKDMKKMANAAFPNIKDENKRYAAFAKMQQEEE